jgi:HAD superfamily hydrolase (TIGR01549 family)
MNVTINNVYYINELYWSVFFDKIKAFEGVNDFIYWNKQNNVKIGVLTDYETEYQIQKLKLLGLNDIIDVVVTSEEVGIEKPSIHMFQTVLSRMKLGANDVIMIGDNLDKDIKGAINSEIYGYLFSHQPFDKNNTKYTNNKYSIFTNFKKLHDEFITIHTELLNFQKMSKFVGERFDLVQAGGGNSSVKVNNFMFIKSSGTSMSNVDIKNGYAVVNNKQILHDILTNDTKDISHYNVIGKNRGSIETFMHSFLKKYTIHLHPIQVNRILITTCATSIISELFPQSFIIDYFTPGITLCNEIYKKYNGENIIFLINHGIIITCDNYEELYQLIESVITTLETYQNINFDKYKNTNTISKYINEKYNVNNVSFLCQNIEIINILNTKIHLFSEKISFPDAVIYCGFEIVFISNIKDDIDSFWEKYNELPKVLIYNNNVYINAHSLQKCREIEEVLLSNLFILDTKYLKNYLSEKELYFLNNWDAEIYRKLLN